MNAKELQKFLISFSAKKAPRSAVSFYSKAVNHIVKKKKNISNNLSLTVDKVLYGS